MELKKYDNYKDSGIEWLGIIPAHWNVTKLKFIGDAIGGLTYSPNDVVEDVTKGKLVLRSSNIQKGKLTLLDNVYVNVDISEKLTLKLGDILICSRNGSQHLIGKNICIDERMEGNTFGAFMIIFRSSNYQFLNHFFNSPIFTSQSGLFLTATINQLTSGTLNNFYIAIPESIEEQTAIANYLDQKTTKIEQLINQKEQLIALLQEERTAVINQAVTNGLDPTVKMKDSDIEWLGEIPEHWFLVPMKRVIEVRDGTHDTPNYVEIIDESFPLITSKDFEGDNINFSNAKMISKDDHEEISKRSGVKCGDVLMSMIGGNIGKSLIIGKRDDFSIKNVALFITRGNIQMANYLRYYFESGLLNRQIELKSRGGAQGFLSLGDIRNLIFFKFKNEELKQIITFLDDRTSEIDLVISKSQQEIELLKEYKTALISEVVTGKVDVRN